MYVCSASNKRQKEQLISQAVEELFENGIEKEALDELPEFKISYEDPTIVSILGTRECQRRLAMEFSIPPATKGAFTRAYNEYAKTHAKISALGEGGNGDGDEE